MAGGDELWRYEGTGGVVSDGAMGSPTVVDGTVYVGSTDYVLYALDASDGSEQWSRDGYSYFGSAPTVIGDTVYAETGEYLFALDATDGSERWSFREREEAKFTAPTVADGTVYAGAYDGNVYAIDASDGSKRWQFETGDSILQSERHGSTPTVVNDTVYVGSGDGNVYAIDASDGSKRWQFETGEGVWSSPTVANDTVFVGCEDSNVYALDASDGSKRWSTSTAGYIRSSPTVSDGVLFIGAYDSYEYAGVVYALDTSDGSTMWGFGTGWSVESAPTVVDETVFVGSNDTNVYALDASDGSKQWQFGTDDDVLSSPTVVDGTVYVGSDDYTLYAIDAGTTGSSDGSRVSLGTLGHHNVWASKQRSTGLDAEITQSTGTPTVDESITFDASDSTGTVESYEWNFDDGTTKTGKTVTHSYESTGNYTVSLTITDGNDVDTTTTDISVDSTDQLGFAFRPSSPAAGEQITFEARGGESYEWAFNDGTSASGSQATHSYDSAATYTVTLSSGSNSVSRDITVESADLQITDIDRSAGGVPLEGISYLETFTATVAGDATVAQVDFELGSEYVIDTEGTDGWSGTFDLGQFSDTTTLTVTAVAESGATVSREQTVTVRSVPEWVEWIIDQGEVTVTEEKTRIDVSYAPFDLESYSFSLGGIPIDADPPDFDGAPEAGVGYDASQQSALVAGAGGLNTTLFGYGFDADFEMEGQVDTDLDLLSASGTTSVSLAVQVGPPLYIDLPSGIPCLSDRLGIETTVEPGLTVTGNFDDQFQFQDGTVTPSAALTVGAQLTICGAGAGASVTGSLSGSFDVGAASRNLSGTVGASGEAWFNVSVFTATVSISFEEQLGSGTESLTAGVTADDIEWSLAEKRGSRPQTSISRVDAGGTLSQTTALEPTADTTSNSYQRLTDRDIEDTQPAVATTGGDTVVVWSRLNETKAVTDGRDIAVRRKSDGSWSELSYLTDNQISEEAPVIAATGSGTLLAAWERVDTTITDQTDPVDIHPYVEIAYAVYDGTRWNSPVTLTDSNDREFRPTVAPAGDGWLLAWTADPDPQSTDRDIRYVRIDGDGTAGSITRVSDASEPSAGSHPDSGAVLGYASLSSGSTDQVVSAKIVDGSQTDATQFSAGDVTALTAGHDRVVWQEGPTDDPTLRDGNRQSGAVTDLTIRADIDAIAKPTLATDGQDAVLAYRGYIESTDSRKLVYRLDRGNGWIYDRQYVQSPTAEETVWQPSPALVADDQHFTTAFAMTEQIQSGKNDIFLATHDFRAEYGIQGSGPSGTSAGETVTLEYTVKNTGDVDGTADVTLSVENGTGTVASQTLTPLAVGETTSGTVDVSVDRTGEFTLNVETEQATMTTTAGTTSGFDSSTSSVTVATPELSVAAVRAGASDTVQIDIQNDGGAAAFDIPVAVSDGTTVLARETVGEIGVGSTQRLLVTVDPTNIDRSGEDRIILDPDWTNQAAVSESARVTPTWLLQPDLALTDEITYRNRETGDATAEILIGNESPIAAEATVQVLRQSDGTVVGEQPVSIEGTETGTVFEIVSVPLDESALSAETPLELTVDSTVPDQDPSTSTTTDEYGPVFDSPAEFTEQWRYEGTKSVQHAAPAVDTDTVYVGGLGSDFRALSRAQQSSQELWSETREGALSDSAPCLGAGLVFVGSGGGTLYAFDPTSSSQRVAWTYEIESAITSSPVFLNDTVYVGANDGTVRALGADGSEVWSSPTAVGGPIYSKLAAANGRVFVTTDDGSVVALDAESGSKQWQVDVGGDLGASGPTVANDTVYVAGDRVYALDAADGSQQWEDSSNYGGTAGATPAVANGTVYVGSADGYLYALNTSDGSARWRFEADDAIAAGPTVANNRIAVASLAGTVSLLDEQGIQLASRSLGESIRAAPVRAGYEILVATESGTVIKFDTGGGT